MWPSALQDLEPQQLLLFVQSFGIPVSSMSKLLQYLDQAVAHDPQTLEQNIMDKSESQGALRGRWALAQPPAHVWLGAQTGWLSVAAPSRKVKAGSGRERPWPGVSQQRLGFGGLRQLLLCSESSWLS